MDRMASPMNSSTTPPWSSITLDMSLKYLLSNSNDCSGWILSTIVVKDAMSEKNMVTSCSATRNSASMFPLNMSCTTGHGTYFPQDKMAFFIWSNVRRICLISLVPWSRSGSLSTETAPICSCAMLSMSSANSRSGRSKYLERKLISFVSKRMPPRMMTITDIVVRIVYWAASTIESLLSTTAADVVRSLNSSEVRSSLVKSGSKTMYRSPKR
mmetsp:Transcript_30273/g.80710  ORF Transcript_30273/g.80710 Transcript_30273/m.80710 type:complete len:213 (-) Transcript_30273:1760-2398(-)